ncbi:MAG TPA: hypothetical protein DIC22_08230 [Chitinophagaceae bacterium]|nr:hypothetical protein [Chitinophagaceae bacterium]
MGCAFICRQTKRKKVVLGIRVVKRKSDCIFRERHPGAYILKTLLIPLAAGSTFLLQIADDR